MFMFFCFSFYFHIIFFFSAAISLIWWTKCSCVYVPSNYLVLRTHNHKCSLYSMSLRQCLRLRYERHELITDDEIRIWIGENARDSPSGNTVCMFELLSMQMNELTNAQTAELAEGVTENNDKEHYSIEIVVDGGRRKWFNN